MPFLSSLRAAFAAVCLLLVSAGSFAALTTVDIDGNAANGHEGVYDDVLDITWLRDANIAASNQFGLTGGILLSSWAIGAMKWETAATFINAMNAENGGAGYLGVNTWRRPTATPVNGVNFVYGTATYDGSTDRSYNLTAPLGVYNPTPGANALGFTGSELAYHYYNNFEAIPECSGTGTSCVKYNTNIYGLHRAPDPNNYLALFDNIHTDYTSSAYWTDIAADETDAVAFRTFWGSQTLLDQDTYHHLWVVASGNVAASAVPVPGAVWLFGSALAGLFGLRRRQA